jgi:hypothetical protein
MENMKQDRGGNRGIGDDMSETPPPPQIPVLRTPLMSINQEIVIKVKLLENCC